MNIQYVAAWLRALSASPEDGLMFYAEGFDFADPPQGRFIRGDRAALMKVFGVIANRDSDNGLGIHTVEATEYLGDQNAGVILWRWRVRAAKMFFGMPAQGREVQTSGMSYHVYEHGKIVREVVYSDQLSVARQLGIWLGDDPGEKRSGRSATGGTTHRGVRH